MKETGFEHEKLDRYFREKDDDKDEPYIIDVFSDPDKEKELKTHLSRKFDELLCDDDLGSENLDSVLYRIHYEINTKTIERNDRKFSRFLKWSLRFAGIIILPLAIFWSVKGYLNSSSGKETWIEIKAPSGLRAQFSLPDGTTGWLNSNSSIKYKGNFITDRHVSLTGEAFFDVVKDNKNPFIVKASEVNVKVLGTKFNIDSYENERNVKVILEEGELIFTNKKMNKSYTMKPNDMVIYDKTNDVFSTELVEPQIYSAWTEGKLVFRNEPLDVIARRLERWYNIDIEINGNIDIDSRLYATFIDESLEEVLDLLNRSLAIDYRIENRSLKLDEIYVKKKVIITTKIKEPYYKSLKSEPMNQ